jgi:two-component system nitrogen regulation response regulator GlnG/two-component system response regulator HydG
MTDRTQTLERSGRNLKHDAEGEARPALVVIWSSDPNRLGEVLLFPKDQEYSFGRGESSEGGPERALLTRQRPGKPQPGSAFESPFLSRSQLLIQANSDRLALKNVGKCPLIDEHGKTVDTLTVSPGEVFEVKEQIAFLCVDRPARMKALQSFPESSVPSFGESDEFGMVGESPDEWALRDNIAFLANRAAHVLILGPSGSGKELAAQAVHSLSPRRNKKLVARNAATLPAGLIEAELFGNVANYPNPGMSERPGLAGEADGSTLFFDEIGELSEELQTRLLRLLDSQGEYHRLGDARRRKADLRFIGATNRPVDALRADIAARLKLRLTMPGLNQLREDVPLIARHLLRRIAQNDAKIGERFFDNWDGRRGDPRMTPALMRALVTHEYSTHVRELEGLLWNSLSTSPDDTLDVTETLGKELSTRAPRVATKDVSAEDVRAALERTGGVQERAWRELGLANRYVLKRLIKKFGLSKGSGSDDDD